MIPVMIKPIDRSHIVSTAISTARNAGWDDDEARSYAVTMVMRYDPTLNAAFAKTLVHQLHMVDSGTGTA